MDINNTSPALRIMFVEDNEHDRAAFCRAFKKSQISYEIKEFVRAEEALEHLSLNSLEFDIVVSDYMLPGMNGLEFCKVLIINDVPLPKVLLTGKGSEQVAVQALMAGIDDYIVKDPDHGYLELLPAVLPEVVRKYGDGMARREAEVALRKSERLSRAWLENSPVCTKIVDLDFNLQYMSSAGVQGLGIENITQYYGKQYPFDFYPESFRDTMTNNLEKAGETGEIIRQEAPVVDLEGNALWFHSTIVPVKDEKGQVEYFMVVSVDTTERRQAEDALRQSHKMESVGTLAGGVAHEFNNILGGITGYTEIAIDDAREDSPVRESLDEILKLSNRARDVVKQILSFSRKGNKEFKPIQPHLIIEDSLKVLRATIPTTIEIKHNIDENSGAILADPIQINQVGMNLCMNAAYAMEESGGVLEIGLSPVVMDAEDVKPYPDLETGEHVKLTVSDIGTGIDPKNIDKIFDPFFTTKGVGKGTGMGLSVVHGIIQDHGGVITVSSKLGEGTTFTVFLPRADGEVKETKAVEPLSTGTESILIVDDEEYLVFPQKKILERLGYTVTAMTSSLEALELFTKDPQRYDLIITDLTMPHMTGDQLASEITTIRPDMPIILSTGYADAINDESVKQSGIKSFIPKPCQKHELAKTIRLILDEKC